MLDISHATAAANLGITSPPLTRASSLTLAERFASRIRDRLLVPGARLLSVRCSTA